MLKKQHLQKMKNGRLKHFEKNQGLVCRINNEIEIWADKHQFILKINGQTEGYYPNIISVLDALLEFKEKELMLASKEKNLLSIKQAIQESREWMKKIIKPLLYPEDKKPIS